MIGQETVHRRITQASQPWGKYSISDNRKCLEFERKVDKLTLAPGRFVPVRSLHPLVAVTHQHLHTALTGAPPLHPHLLALLEISDGGDAGNEAELGMVEYQELTVREETVICLREAFESH